MPDPFDQVTQRTVPAKGSGALLPNASPFAAGQAAKPKRKAPGACTIDPMMVEIRSGIPLPERTAGPRPAFAKTLLERMQPGDSCVLPKAQARSVKAYANRNGMKVSLRVDDSDDNYGVWRDA